MQLFERFAEVIAKMQDTSLVKEDRVVKPENVFQEKYIKNRHYLYEIVGELMEDDSTLYGAENLLELGRLSAAGHACLMLPAHLSNFDVPCLWRLMRESGPDVDEVFERIVFVAGRKLNEESAVVKIFTEMFARVVISPKTMHEGMPDGPEKERVIAEGQAINLAAYRKIRELKKKGRIFLIYPTGTRYRPWDESSGRGLREVDTYLRSFDYFVVGATKGNLMPPEKKAMHAETPRQDNVSMRFGKVVKTSEFREQCFAEMEALAEKGQPVEDAKQYIVDRVMDLIADEEKQLP